MWVLLTFVEMHVGVLLTVLWKLRNRVVGSVMLCDGLLSNSRSVLLFLSSLPTSEYAYTYWCHIQQVSLSLNIEFGRSLQITPTSEAKKTGNHSSTVVKQHSSWYHSLCDTHTIYLLDFTSFWGLLDTFGFLWSAHQLVSSKFPLDFCLNFFCVVLKMKCIFGGYG